MPIKIKRLLAVVVSGVGVFGMFAPAASGACQTGTVKFVNTAAEQCYVVPGDVTGLQITAVGAPGGSPSPGVEFGAVVGAAVPVSSDETLYVEVGGAGGPMGAGAGGFNGGGTGGTPGAAGGGGASDVRSVSDSTGGQLSLGSRLLVAGGGGGANGFLQGSGGNADGPGGGLVDGIGGGAGGIGGGGAGGNSPTCNPPAASIGSPGTFGQGGAGGSGHVGGGGGGGGYYGGGGGQGGTTTGSCDGGGGGGGGGSFVTPSASAVKYATDSTGVPSVQITPQTPSTPPQGPPGPPGQTGATGPRGPQGPAGKIELVTCTAVTTGTRKHKHKSEKCSAKLVSGPVKFTTTASIQASITRGHLIYATGEAIPAGDGRWQLVLTHQMRQLRPGRYTLTLRTPRGQRRINHHTTITIT